MSPNISKCLENVSKCLNREISPYRLHQSEIPNVLPVPMQTWDWARLRSQSWIFFWHGHKMLSKDVNHHSHTYFTLWCEKLMSRIQEKPIAHSSLTIPKFWVKKYLSRYSPTTATYVSILWNWRCEFVKWHCHVNWMI